MRLAVVLLLLFIAGCASNGDVEVVERSIEEPVGRAPPASPRTTAPARTYTVVRGDTLFGIAFRNGVDVRDLVRWNRIADPDTIYAGQVLKLGESARVASSSSDPSARVRARDTDRTTARRELPRGSAYPPRHRSDRGTRQAEAQAKPLREGEVEVRGLDDAAAVTQPLQPATRDSTVGGTTPSPIDRTPRSTSRPSPSTVDAGRLATAVDDAAPATSPVVAAPDPAPIVTPPPPAPSANQPAPAAIQPAATRTASGVAWRWPARGSVMQRYAAGDPARQGIDIRGNAGDAVTAAADGEVVYSGNGLLGYGELIIVKHSEAFLSAYAHNRARLVKEGDRVKAGQQIAEMGSTGAGTPALHFEIRQNGKPVDPLNFLPKP